jgi:sugar phosphate isomerase/epimerase
MILKPKFNPMNKNFSRRNFLQTAAISASALTLPSYAFASEKSKKGTVISLNKNPLKIGLMTYTLGKDWDIETIIKNCTETKFQNVELRTTHAHGVEVTLSPAERAAVKKRFEDAGLAISLASGFQYHYADQAELKKNIDGTKEYILLARDVGAKGIRVFAGSIYRSVPEEKTLVQIAKALAEVGEYANNYGVEIRVCNDGPPISMIKKIIDLSQSPYVFVNWNCPMSDMEGKGFEYNFNSVKDRIRGIHMHEIWNDYPWRLFFKLLSKSGYQGYCNAEVKGSEDPIRFMKYYRALFLAYQDAI